MPYTKTGYGPGGAANTDMSLRGVDLPPVPDFWGDWASMQSRLRPEPRQQARALREPRQPRMQMPSPESMHSQALAPRSNQVEGPRTARSFGSPSMSPQGRLGTFVSPLDIPPDLVGTLPTGFFDDDASGNYTYSPTVNPMRYATGKTQRV